MTTRHVLNTLKFQVDGHGCLGGEKNTILTFPNCQDLKLSENSFSFDKSMSFVGPE